MPYYRITIKVRGKRAISGIRELDRADIDYAWRYFQNKIYQEYRQSEVLSFDVVMVSKLSEEVKAYLQNPKRPPRQS